MLVMEDGPKKRNTTKVESQTNSALPSPDPKKLCRPDRLSGEDDLQKGK